MTSANLVIERTVALVGGVLLTNRVASDVWSYPNVHGDVVAVANAAGLNQEQGAPWPMTPTGWLWPGWSTTPTETSTTAGWASTNGA